MIETLKFIGTGVGVVTAFVLIAWIVEICWEVLFSAFIMILSGCGLGCFFYFLGKTILTGNS